MTLSADIKKHLAEQARSSGSYLATVEAVDVDATRVRITPLEEGGCGCEDALVVALDHIETFAPVADRWHDCCGKRLQVVRVSLKADATIRVSDITAARASRAARAPVQPFLPSNNLDCWKQELACIKAGNPYGWCHAHYEDCIGAYDARGGSFSSPDRTAARKDPACYSRCVDEFADCRNSGLSKQQCAQIFQNCIRPCGYNASNL